VPERLAVGVETAVPGRAVGVSVSVGDAVGVCESCDGVGETWGEGVASAGAIVGVGVADSPAAGDGVSIVATGEGEPGAVAVAVALTVGVCERRASGLSVGPAVPIPVGVADGTAPAAIAAGRSAALTRPSLLASVPAQPAHGA
jgi:hypothetical protein